MTSQITSSKTKPDRKVKPKLPSLYKVILLNDDITPMEFVIDILCGIFGFTKEKSAILTDEIHNNGLGICGIYSYEIAETKMSEVMEAARVNKYPLECLLEKE